MGCSDCHDGESVREREMMEVRVAEMVYYNAPTRAMARSVIIDGCERERSAGSLATSPCPSLPSPLRAASLNLI